MKKLVLRSLAPALALLALVAAVLAALDETRWALALGLLVLGGAAALTAETYRRTAAALARSARDQRAEARKLTARFDGLAGRIDRLESRTARRVERVGDKTVGAAGLRKIVGEAGGGDRTLTRLEAAERRLLLSTERVRLEVQDVHELAAATSGLPKAVDRLTADVVTLTKRVPADRFATRDLIVEAVRNIDATLQLHPLVSARAPLPPTGGFAMSARNLLHLVTLVRDAGPTTVVELGSGTSTVWLGYLAESAGGRVVALDHLEEYADATTTAVAAHGLDGTVEVRLAPLTSVGLPTTDQPWYDRGALADLREIDVLLVDGPPERTAPLARYPALPVLVDQLADRAWVLLDDAARDDEKAAVTRWLDEIDGLEQVAAPTDSLVVLRYTRPGT